MKRLSVNLVYWIRMAKFEPYSAPEPFWKLLSALHDTCVKYEATVIDWTGNEYSITQLQLQMTSVNVKRLISYVNENKQTQ